MAKKPSKPELESTAPANLNQQPKELGLTAPVFRSGRWHLRDGNKFGKPPYYADLTRRNLRSPDER